MKKQKTQRKLTCKAWILIGAAVLVLAAAAAAVLVLGGFSQKDQQNLSAPVSDGKIYWNIDRLQYLEPADNKVPYYTSRALRDGIYVVRMATGGEQMDIKVREMLTVQQMDNWDFMGLLFDDEGYAVDVVPPSLLSGEVLEDLYIQAIDGQTVTLNTSPFYTALERQITVTEQTAVYNVANYDGSGLFSGLAGKLSLDDKVDVIFDEEGNVTQIFTEPYQLPDDVYFNTQRLYDSTLKMTTRQADSLGYYNYEFAVNGELVNLRTKDQEVANKIDQQSNQWMGLQFNEDGEISGVVTGGVAVHGKGAALNTSVLQIANEDGFVTVTSLSPTTRTSSKVRLHSACAVYDFSGGSDYIGQATQLQEGDYIRCLRDSRDRVVYIAVIYRPGVAQHAYILDRNYDSEEKQTARTPDGYGYYHIKVTMGGETMTLRCNDKQIVNYIDAQGTNIVGLRVKGDVILGHTPAAHTLAGYYLASGWDVTALDTQEGTIEVTAMSGDAKGTVKTGKLSENLVVYNVSTMATTVGEISHVQVGDTVRAYTNYKGEVEVIYVTVSPMVSPAYRKLRAWGQQEDGYYHYLMSVNGKQVVIKAKAADVVDRMNKSTTLGLYVNSDNVAYKAVAATQVVGSNGGLFGSNYTVTGISGGQITVSKDGETLSAPLAAGYKAYDVAAAGSRTGIATDIRVGDTVQCFKNKAGEVTLVYVTKRPTHNTANHCACYGGEHVADHSACQQLTWQKLPDVVDNKVTITESGSYHLTGNTSAALVIENGLTVNLCLNGYALQSRQAVAVKDGAVLNLSDCTGGGYITSTHETNGGYGLRVNGGVANMYSGSILGIMPTKTDRQNRCVQVFSGEFYMYGGQIRDGIITDNKNGGNVLVMGGSFTMLGGSISGGQVENGKGTDVYVDNGTVMTISGTAQAGHVYVAKEGTLLFHESLDATKASAQVCLADLSADIGTGTAKEGYTQAITSDVANYVTAFDSAKNALYLKPVATDGHIHCACGDDSIGCDHREKEYIPLTQAMFDNAVSTGTVRVVEYTHSGLKVKRTAYNLASGNYYLAEDIVLDKEIYLGVRDVALCLNGHTVTSAYNVFTIGNTVNLTISDHDNKGALIGKGVEGQDGGVIWNNANTSAITIYGGCYTLAQNHNGVAGGGVITATGQVTLYDGIITGGAVSNYGGSIKMNANDKSIFTMYGGTVTGGAAKEGANISGRATDKAKSQIHLLGGTVTGSTGTDKSADVFAAGLISVGGDMQLGGVYLASGVCMEVSDDFAGKHSIGVNAADMTAPVASGLTSGQAAAFTSTNHDYETSYDAQAKALYLTVKKHIHCACVGSEHIADHTACTQVQWQEAPAVADNKITITESGHYYLTGNVAATLSIADGLTVDLCLNGYKLYGRTPVTVAAGVKLNICDHTGSGMIYSSREDGTGYALKVNGGEVNLYSGILTGKHADKEVYNRPAQVADGTFTMYGGTISGGVAKAGENGGNVLVTGGTFTILGGEVTGGTAAVGGGVYAAGGQVVIGGTAKITDNTDTNLYITDAFTLSAEHPLAEGAQIGVARADNGPVATGLTAQQVQYISADVGKLVYDDTSDPSALNLEIPHNHCICVGSEHIADHTACPQVEWKAAPAKASNKITFTENGCYYLTTTVAASLAFSEDVTEVSLCLNGYNLYAGTPVTVSAGVKLNICDHSETSGWIFSSKADASGYAVKVDGGEVNLYSGVLSGKHADKDAYNRPVQLTAGQFNMYGGAIRNGMAKSGENGGNVLITGGSFCMYGGTISGGQVTGSNKHGGNVCIQNGSFLLQDGTITAGQATGKGGNVMVWSDAANKYASFTMTGGTISGGLTEEGKVNAANGGNVCVNSANGDNRSSVFTITGGTVTGGKVSGEGGGVFVYKSEGSSVTVGGTANITGNTAGGVENNVYLDQGKTLTFHSETALDADNTDGTVALIGIRMHTAGVFAEASDEAQALLYQLCFRSNDSGNPNITADGSSLKLGA